MFNDLRLLTSALYLVVSSCTGTQKKETLTNCVISPCMVMKTIGIPSCTGTPGQPLISYLIMSLIYVYHLCDKQMLYSPVLYL